MPRDMEYFCRKLRERNVSAELAQAVDAELWKELGTELAILVGDMSGFTRLSKRRGILHFLAMHQLGLALANPIIAEHGGSMVKSEADNIIACFPNPVDAARCAIALQRMFDHHNLTVADPDSQLLHCMGLGFGRVLRLADDVFGEEVNVAYKLGEDIARPNEILVSEPAHAAILAVTNEFGFSAHAHADAGNVNLGFYRLAVH